MTRAAMGSPRIDKLPLDATPKAQSARGEWYVARDATDEWGDDHAEYLHADGVWRESTFSLGSSLHDDKPTGYFETEEEAKAALAKAHGKRL